MNNNDNDDKCLNLKLSSKNLLKQCTKLTVLLKCDLGAAYDILFPTKKLLP